VLTASQHRTHGIILYNSTQHDFISQYNTRLCIENSICLQQIENNFDRCWIFLSLHSETTRQFVTIIFNNFVERCIEIQCINLPCPFWSASPGALSSFHSSTKLLVSWIGHEKILIVRFTKFVDIIFLNCKENSKTLSIRRTSLESLCFLPHDAFLPPTTSLKLNERSAELHFSIENSHLIFVYLEASILER